jgi:hypothetical protein
MMWPFLRSLFRLVDFLVKIWPALALAYLNLPDPVFLNLLAAALLVFIFGIVRFSCHLNIDCNQIVKGALGLAVAQMQMAQAVNITARAM